jgi:NADPH-dependent curcumin reductase CurA
LGTGQTALVAPAAGSVGMVATQLLARRSVRVAGVVGGEAQAGFVRDLGAAATVDHRAEDLGTAFADALPDGWDAFLDGVGGAVHDAALVRMNVHARMVLFGFVSGYGAGPPAYGAAPPILLKRARAEGFLLADYRDRWDEARRALADALSEGSVRAFNHVTHGLENAPAAFASLFGDAAPGKQLVRLTGERDG